MNKKQISIGEFAKLANTTKRTLQFYDKKGLLKPYSITKKGYRRYLPKQILDYQAINLLTKLQFSLDEIRAHLKGKGQLQDLFLEKKDKLKEEIKKLNFSLERLNEYFVNLKDSGLLINPVVKRVPSFSVYYIEKVGAYSEIHLYINELISMFEKLPKDSTYLTLYLDKGYKPKESKMKICVIKNKEMKIAKRSLEEMSEMRIPSYKAITYTHNGPPSYLSFLWQSMNKYFRDNGFTHDDRFTEDLEFYHKNIFQGYKVQEEYIFELQIPVL